MALKNFLLCNKDHDRKLFSIEGPMDDDTPWIDLVIKGQKLGKQLQCETLRLDLSKEEAITSIAKSSGYKHVTSKEIFKF